MQDGESLLFIPGHPFNDFLVPARNKDFYGGRGSGKSWGAAEALVRMGDAAKLRILCGREFQNSIADSVHQILADTITRWWLNSRYHITDHHIRNRYTGTEFFFRGMHHNVSAVRSIEGVDILWLEEAQTASETTYKEIVPTIRKPGSEIWRTWNVIHESDPTYMRAILNPHKGSVCHKVNYDMNPFFPDVLEQERQYYLGLIRDAKDDAERDQAQADYDHVWEGMPLRRTGAGVIKRWEIAEFDVPRDVHWLHGVDWGFSVDPAALIRFFIKDECLFIESEAFGYGVEIDDLYKLFDSIDTSRDWPIRADNSRPETISYMRRQGFNISAADKWPGSVEDGVAHLNGFKRIYIHPRCKHIATEARLYQYKIDQKTNEILPIIVDKHNHGWDGVRYGLDGYIQRRGGMGVWAKLGQD